MTITNNLTPSDLEKYTVKFSLRTGRRFSFSSKDNISLNDLLKSFQVRLSNNSLSKRDALTYLKIFQILQNKGYEDDGLIQKENFLVRIITKLKHFFAGIRRRKLLTTIAKQILLMSEPSKPLSTKNEMKGLPKVISQEVCKYLDPESLYSLSKTDKQHLKLVRESHTDNILDVYSSRQALKSWKKACLCNSFDKKTNFVMHRPNYEYIKSDFYGMFAQSAAKLFRLYPEEVKNTLEKSLDYVPLTRSLAAMKECAKIDRVAMMPLFEKAYRMAKRNIDVSTCLYFYVEALAPTDAEKALTIARKISNTNKKNSALREVAVAVHTNDQNAFGIVKNQISELHAKILTYEKMLESCSNLDKEKALIMIVRIQDEAEKEIARASEENSIYYREELSSALCRAYCRCKIYDMALKFCQRPEPTERDQISHLKLQWLWDKVVLASEYDSSIPAEKLNSEIEQILTSTIVDDDPSTKDLIFELLACGYLRNDELKKVEDLVEKFHTLRSKVSVLATLASKYKKIDKEKMVQLLEKAISLIDKYQPENREIDDDVDYKDGSEVLALAMVAKEYASIDREKACTLAKRAEARVRHVGIGKEGRFNRIQVAITLSRAFGLIDRKYAVGLINEFLPDEHPCKAFLLLRFDDKDQTEIIAHLLKWLYFI